MATQAVDGFTILALGASIGYLYTMQQKAESQVVRAVAEYRAQDKPSANRPTPAEIRDSHKVCPVKEVNLQIISQKGISNIKKQEKKAEDEVKAYDLHSGGLNEPPPPVIQGVYLNFGE